MLGELLAGASDMTEIIEFPFDANFRNTDVVGVQANRASWLASAFLGSFAFFLMLASSPAFPGPSSARPECVRELLAGLPAWRRAGVRITTVHGENERQVPYALYILRYEHEGGYKAGALCRVTYLSRGSRQVGCRCERIKPWLIAE